MVVIYKCGVDYMKHHDQEPMTHVYILGLINVCCKYNFTYI